MLLNQGLLFGILSIYTVNVSPFLLFKRVSRISITKQKTAVSAVDNGTAGEASFIDQLESAKLQHGEASSKCIELMLKIAERHASNVNINDNDSEAVDTAEQYYQSAWEAIEMNYYLNPKPTATDDTKYIMDLRTVYAGLGHMRFIKGNDEEAENYYNMVEEIYQYGEPHDFSGELGKYNFAPIFRNMAILSSRSGNHKRAKQLFDKALICLKEQGVIDETFSIEVQGLLDATEATEVLASIPAEVPAEDEYVIRTDTENDVRDAV